MRRTRERAADAIAEAKFRAAKRGFRPRKGERGSVVFLGRDGKRSAAKKGRVGYALYINRKGKISPVRQYDRKTLRLERTPKTHTLAGTDISRVRSNRAKKRFLEAHTTEISRGQTIENSRYGFRRNFRRIDVESDFAEYAAAEMLKILRGMRSVDRNLALQIGVNATTPDGVKFFETQIDALPGDLRKSKIETITLGRLKHFFGRQVYAFIAREMSASGYVMAGSAQYVRRLAENKRRRKDKWTKGGHIWGGIGKTEIKINSVEWRFLQLTFTNR
jgi:hypothetical protein